MTSGMLAPVDLDALVVAAQSGLSRKALQLCEARGITVPQAGNRIP
jgi:hypothetical protein